jgi:hypothetical protein
MIRGANKCKKSLVQAYDRTGAGLLKKKGSTYKAITEQLVLYGKHQLPEVHHRHLRVQLGYAPDDPDHCQNPPNHYPLVRSLYSEQSRS